jgi:hypothetical protein
MPGIQRFTSLWLTAVLIAGGCATGNPDAPAPLTPEEVRLVEETLQLIRIRLEATRDPEAAEELRANAVNLYTEEERELLLDRLAVDSRRGELVMAALHDSLQTLREELFPASGP